MCNAIKNALYKRFNIRGNKRAANNINNIYKLILTALYYIYSLTNLTIYIAKYTTIIYHALYFICRYFCPILKDKSSSWKFL